MAGKNAWQGPMHAFSEPSHPTFTDSRDRNALWLVFFAAILVFLNSFPGSFFMDDVLIVARNPLVHQPDLLAIFTSDYWGEQINSGLYRPLTILSFAFNRWLLGPNPWSFHLVNVLLHAAASGLLGLSLRACGVGLFVAWGGALLFAVHPLHTEAVNTAVGRSELLVGVLLFTALWLSRRVAGGGRPGGVALCYGLALLAKEHAVVFLVLLPVIDAFGAERAPAAWRRRLPLYLLLAGVTLAWLALRTFGVEHGDIPRDPYDPVYVPLAFLPDGVRMLTALKLQLLYLAKLLFPFELQGVYGGPGLLVPVTSPVSLGGAMGLAALGGYVAVTWWALRRSKLLGLALLLYAITFAPTANIFFVTGVTFAERLAYLPSAWFCLGAAAGAEVLSRRFSPRPVAGIALVCLLAYAGVTVLRNRDFSEPIALWQANVRTDPSNPLAWMLLATAQENLGQMPAAEESYRTALRWAPGFADAHRSYGALLYGQGRYREALAQGHQAVAHGIGTFGSAYVLLARTHLRLGEWAEALAATEQLAPFQRRRYGLYWELRGLALEGLGDMAGALAAYEQEIVIEPDRMSDVHERIERVRQGLGPAAAPANGVGRDAAPGRQSRAVEP